jgi:hypothetical protein
VCDDDRAFHFFNTFLEGNLAMKKLLLLITFPAACTMLANSLALAGAANVASGDGTKMKFEYRDQDLRIDMKGQEGYMLVTGGSMYVVSVSNGQTMVIDMKQARNMFGNMADTATPSAMEGELLSFEPAGRNEVVAGIEGEVYEVRFIDADGKERSSEMVLSDDPRAEEFRDAVFAMARSATAALSEQAEAADEMQQRLRAENKGVLRFGGDMTVTALSDRVIDKSRFVLPAAPTDLSAMGGLGDMLGAQTVGGQSAEEEEESEGIMSSVFGAFGKKAEEKSDRAEQKTENKIDRETDKAVDSVLDKAFGKLLGK